MTIATHIFIVTFIYVFYLKNFTCPKICDLSSELCFFTDNNSINTKPDYMHRCKTN